MAQEHVYVAMFNYAKTKCMNEEVLKANDAIVQDCAKQAADCLMTCIAKINKVAVMEAMFNAMKERLTYMLCSGNSLNRLYSKPEVDLILKDNEANIQECANQMIKFHDTTNDLTGDINDKLLCPTRGLVWDFMQYNYETKKVVCRLYNEKIYHAIVDYIKSECGDDILIQDCAKKATQSITACIKEIKRKRAMDPLVAHIYEIMVDSIKNTLDEEDHECSCEINDGYLYNALEVKQILEDNADMIHECATKMVESYKETNNLDYLKHPMGDQIRDWVQFDHKTKKVYCP